MIKSKKMKKAYREPEVTLVRFSAEDVLGTASDLPPLGDHETPVTPFPSANP